MKRRIISVLICAVLVLNCASTGYAQTASNEHPAVSYTEDDFSAGRILIKKDDTQDIEQLKDEYSLAAAQPIDTSSLTGQDGSQELYLATVEDKQDAAEICRRLNADSSVIFAEPDYTAQISEVSLPDEVLQSSSAYSNFNRYFSSLGVADAWQAADTMGSEEVCVAVLDTGLNISHPDIDDNLKYDENGNCGYNVVSDNYDISDKNGHGSNVAGIIAMEADNQGFVGIAPKVKIMPIKVSESSDGSMYISDVIKGINYAVEHGADIINMSLGSQAFSESEIQALQLASQHSVLVAAAGNSSQDANRTEPVYPAAAGCVIGVMSCGNYEKIKYPSEIENDCLSSFSNYDSSGIFYDICAPGVNIESLSKSGDTYDTKSGTSQSAPAVAGAAALYMSKYPSASPYQTMQAILDSADEIVSGGDGTKYKKLNIKSALAREPKDTARSDLSENAKEILKNAFGKDSTDEIDISHEKYITLITKDCLQDKSYCQYISELKNVQIIDLSSMSLENEDTAFFKSTVFPALVSLEIDNNKNFSNIDLGENINQLRTISFSRCAFKNLMFLKSAKKLTRINANDNKISHSYPLGEVKTLEYINLKNNILQDAQAFSGESLPYLDYLNLNSNKLTDISPLYTYKGSSLYISDNPLNYGKDYTTSLKTVENSISHAGHNTYVFEHKNINKSGFTPAKEIIACDLNIPRASEVCSVSIKTIPQNSDLNNAFIFTSAQIQTDPFSGEVKWNKFDIAESVSYDISVQPTTAFASTSIKLNILAPEILSFYRCEGGAVITANTAADYITVGTKKYTQYEQVDNHRIFTVQGDLPEDSLAYPYDEAGAGKSAEISDSAPPVNASDKILSFTADSDSYIVGQTAVLKVTTEPGANFVRLKSVNDSASTTISSYTENPDGTKTFTFRYKIKDGGSYSFKAYSSSDESFSFGASTLKIDASLPVQSISIENAASGTLYLENKNSIQLNASYFPKNADAYTDITFSSSNPAVIEVDSEGVARALSYGTSIITAENALGIQASAVLKVSPPELKGISVLAKYTDEQVVFVAVGAGAREILLLDKDKSPIDKSLYTVSQKDIDEDGFDTEYSISYTGGVSGENTVYLAAVDRLGINESTSLYKETFTLTEPAEDFEISAEKYNVPRSERTLKIGAVFTPADSCAEISYTSSDSAVATVSEDSNSHGVVLNIISAGFVTITAQAQIGGRTISKSLDFHITEPAVKSAETDNSSPSLYEAVSLSVLTSSDADGLLVCGDNSKNPIKYSEYFDYKDTPSGRSWNIRYFLTDETDFIRIYASDSHGTSSECFKIPVNLNKSASRLAVNPPEVTCSASSQFNISAYNLPSNDEAVCFYSSSDESIASVSADGLVDIVNIGTCIIYAEDENGNIAECKINAYRNIDKIVSNNTNISLKIGASLSLDVKTEPEAVTENIVYQSENENIARVDSNGVVSAVSAGVTHITALSQSKRAQLKYEITVLPDEVKLQSIKFEHESYNICVGETFSPTIKLTPQNSNEKILFETSNKNILKPIGDGNYEALSSGVVTITAYTQSGLSASAEVNVTYNPTFSLVNRYISVSKGSGVIIRTSLSEKDYYEKISWYSSSPSVARVTSNGIAYGINPGECDIYACNSTGILLICHITVESVPITSFTLNSYEISLACGQSYISLSELNPQYATQSLKWTCSDTDTAIVNSYGRITAVSAGTCTVTAEAPNGFSKSIEVTVTPKPVKISGKIKADYPRAATVTLNGSSGEKYVLNLTEDESEFTFYDIPCGTYSLNVKMQCHTQAAIKDIDISEDTEIGGITLYCGDVNADGSITSADTACILSEKNYLKSVSECDEPLCDINSDGIVSSADVAIVINNINYLKGNEQYIW